VDWGAVEAALALYQGTHDFTSFRGPRCEERSPVRTIERVEHRRLDDDLHAIEFAGPGFLRYQVRIMVGTALEVGLGRRTVAAVEAALTATDRHAAGRTALAEGLYLVEVRYPADLLRAPGEPPGLVAG
jgi:tRNA pseudouridine38-40 synthase